MDSGIVAITAIAAGLLAMRAARPPGPAAAAWRWLALGCFARAAGELLALALHPAGASSADLARFAGVLLLLVCWAAALGRSLLGRDVDADALLDAATIAVAGAGTAYVFLVRPVASAEFDGVAVTGLAGQVGLAVLLVGALVALAWSRAGRERRLAATLVAVVTTPAAVAAFEASRTGVTAGATALGWGPAFAAVALAALAAARSRPSQPLTAARPGPEALGRFCWVASSAVAMQAITRVRVAIDAGVGIGVVGTSLALGVLIFLRLQRTATLAGWLAQRTRERDRLSAVVDFSSAIVAAPDIEALLRQAAAAAALAVDRTYAEAVLRLADGKTAAVTTGDPPPGAVGGFDVTSSIADRRSPVVVVPEAPWLDEAARASWAAHGRHEALVLPILAEHLVGHIAVWSAGPPRGFDPEDVATATAVVHEGALALRNAVLLEQERRRAEERAVLLRVTRAATASLDLYEVLDEIARAATGVAGIEGTTIELWHPATDELEIGAEVSIPEWPGVNAPGTRFPVDYWAGERALLASTAPCAFECDDPGLDANRARDMRENGIGSMLVFPIRMGGSCLGLIDFYSRTPGAFGEAARRLGAEIAAQTAIAVHHARLLTSEQDRAHEWAVLHRVGRAASSSLELQSVLNEVARASLDIPGAEECTIQLWDADRREVVVVADVAVDGWETTDSPGSRFPDDGWSFNLRVMETGEPRIVEADDPALREVERRGMAGYGIASLAVVPIVRGDRSVGLFLVSARRPRAFSAATLRLGREIATQIALAVHNAGLLEAERRSAQEWSVLHRVSRAAIASLDRPTLLHEIARACLAIPGTEGCTIFSWDKRTNELVVEADAAVPDWDDLDAPGTRYPLVDGAAEYRAMERRMPIIVSPDDADLVEQDRRVLLEYEFNSLVIIPVWLSGDGTGFVYLRSRQFGAFNESTVKLGAEIGAQAALAFNNTHLLEAERRRAEERSLLHRVSQAAASSLDLRAVLMQIAQVSLDVHGAESCDIVLIDLEAREFELGAEVAVPDWPGVDPPGTRYPFGGRSYHDRLLTERSPVVVRRDDPALTPDDLPALDLYGAGSMALFPLWIGDAPVGLLQFFSRRCDAFGEQTVRIGAEIAVQTALAIQNAQLLQTTQRFAEEQAALLRVSRAISAGRDLETVMNEVAQASLAIAGAECCEIEILRLVDEATEVVASQCTTAWTTGQSPLGKRLPLEAWPSTRRVLEARAAAILSPDTADLTPHERELFFKGGVQSALVLPMAIDDRALGIITCYASQPNAFGPESVELGKDLATQAAIALDRAQMIAALEEQANTDGLTGLYNHRAIQERLDAELDRAERSDETVAVLMIDLDRFKLVNDTYGHLAGDGVLQRAAAVLRNAVRGYDVVGRYGGDEFMVILPGADTVEALAVGERIASSAARARIGDFGSGTGVGFSVGLAVYPIHGGTRQQLIDAADRAMYQAKQQHRSVVADPILLPTVAD